MTVLFPLTDDYWSDIHAFLPDAIVVVGTEIELLIPERFRTAHVKHTQSYFKEPRLWVMGVTHPIDCSFDESRGSF